jgi:hypothetical protein
MIMSGVIAAAFETSFSTLRSEVIDDQKERHSVVFTRYLDKAHH